MKIIILYSPGAFQAYGHSYDYSKGLSEAFHELGYQVHLFGESGPLQFPAFVNTLQIPNTSKGLSKKTISQKINWGLSRIGSSKRILKEFVNYYKTFDYEPLIIFETFEYYSLSRVINNFTGNYFCVYHDTNFNFKQTSLLAGIYKYFARIPSRRIVSNSRKIFVHGNNMKSNFIKQIGTQYHGKIESIPYGAPMPMRGNDDEKQKARSDLGLNKELNYLLSFGTLRSDKVYKPIIEALKNTKSWYWIIAGPEGDYSYSDIMSLARIYDVEKKIRTFPEFIINSEQSPYFMASDLVINLYKPFIRHESGTAQLARTFVKPIIVSGPPDLTDYVTRENIGWVAKEPLNIENILKEYEGQTKDQKEQMLTNIYELAIQNSWNTVAQKILSYQ